MAKTCFLRFLNLKILGDTNGNSFDGHPITIKISKCEYSHTVITLVKHEYDNNK